MERKQQHAIDQSPCYQLSAKLLENLIFVTISKMIYQQNNIPQHQFDFKKKKINNVDKTAR